MFSQTKYRRSFVPICLNRSVLWWLFAALVLLVVLLLLSEPVVAQTRRSVELMDRALELRPDVFRGRYCRRSANGNGNAPGDCCQANEHTAGVA